METNAIITLLMRERSVIESSSSSSDEEWETALKERVKRKLRPRIEIYSNVVERYTDHEFKSHFRMSKATFEFLHRIIHLDLNGKVTGCPTMPSQQQLMIAIWKMATMDSYTFNVGRATAVRAVRRVTRALFIRASSFIQWPSGDRAISIMRGFEIASAFPRVIGAIDGTHICIDCPKKNPADYINRKGFHSIQLQLVCDHKTVITHCYAGHPGCIHDQRIFRLSEVANYLNDDDKFPGDSHILGDSAYELHQHLLTPYRDNGHLTERQKNYNYRQSAARVTVERCIGSLKGRIISLLHCLPMSRMDLMPEYIIACCVIHNICVLQGDEIAVTTIPGTLEKNVRNANVFHEVRRNAGVYKRDVIMNTLQ